MNGFAALVARLIARRPGLMICGLLFVALASAGVLATRQNFDSDVLNLLPSDRASVQGLKLLNSRFTQARELTFVIQGPDADAVSSFQAELVDQLRSAPWVVRLLDGSPMESDTGAADLQRLVVPMLMNLTPAEFQSAIDDLSPDRIQARVERLRRGFLAGAPGAQVELENDPLGLLAHAGRPVWEAVSIEDSLSTISEDGKTRLVPVMTNQPDLSAETSQQLMKQVNAFVENLLRTHAAPEVTLQVTGRAAYVDQISRSMKRDIQFTSLVSLLAVTGLFWFSFRQILPLVGLSLLLAISALAALAVGSLIFAQLNVIAIGFCSILFGLGDDFGLLLIERYRSERRAGRPFEESVREALAKMAPGILWVAATTSVGFLALALGGSPGFSQLGALVAIGVFACAAIVAVFLFLFVRRSAALPKLSAADHVEQRISGITRHPGRIAAVAGGILCILFLMAVLPWKPLSFDTSPSSMEPRHAPAAKALAAIMNAFPSAFEPILVVGEFADPAEAPTASRALEARFRELRDAGVIDRFSSPSALLLDAERSDANARSLQPEKLTAIREAWESALVAAGFDPQAFSAASAQLDQLSAIASGATPTRKWSEVLETSSSWWFLLDRMIADHGGAIIAFVQPSTSYQGAEHSPDLEQAIAWDNSPFKVTGWTQTLGSLVPWAERELLVFGSAVAAAVLFILAFVYRDFRLWAIHAAGLALSVGATVATLKLTGQKINLLNVLAFPLLLAVGVDYGIHLLLALREGRATLGSVIKPVAISGLTTAAGFGALALAENPSLYGFGVVSATGVLWSLIVGLFFILPCAAATDRLASRKPMT